ncbi:MAG: hypothetical protein PHI83_10365 [Sphaerochaetaceae bacterium]|nr:hypothetical protein [Sphaerochaetaceae bacterium]
MDILDGLEKWGWDRKGCMDRFLGDKDLFIECFHEALGTDDVALLAACFKNGDGQEAFLKAHEMKGVSANLGLVPFTKAISCLVEDLRPGKDITAGKASFVKVLEVYKDLLAAVSIH